MTNAHLLNLQPRAIWQHFQTLCNTPRPSFHEKAIRDYLVIWSQSLGLTHHIDSVGNIIIYKPATEGMELSPGIVLQGHLDMVAQKEPESTHDFIQDPIETHIKGGWLWAKQTTLGADNGIGVAAAMAVLESQELCHGPIEALFTIEEETSLRGALQLEEGVLKGRYLLNLDSEDRGDVYIGCAGGVDINVEKHFEAHSIGAQEYALKLRVSGLSGGHSGLDIHKGRGSANVLLVRLLKLLQQRLSFQLSDLSGGTLRNAIAREAYATIIIPGSIFKQVEQIVAQYLCDVELEYSGIEESIRIELEQVDASLKLSSADTLALISSLHVSPHGVHRMSSALPGVTETSCNFGVMRMTAAQHEKALQFSACYLVRSLIDSAINHQAWLLDSAFSQLGAKVSFDNAYPGWRPDPNAGLLKHFLATHVKEMGQEAKVKVIHAGLECGIIGGKHPQMEMVSFGPNIRGAHSPSERMDIESVADFWRLLCALLESLARETPATE
ncbi:aminoacyl-histidine dipeptidase [Marinomonas epiphytica]